MKKVLFDSSIPKHGITNPSVSHSSSYSWNERVVCTRDGSMGWLIIGESKPHGAQMLGGVGLEAVCRRF